MTKYIVIAVICMILLLIINTYNSLVSARNTVNEAFGTMDVYLKKRWDMIPNVVEIVKGYTKHESETLQKVVAIRNRAYSNMTNEEKMESSNLINESLSKLLALSEDYPDLKASANFLDLSAQLSVIEAEIASGRKYYNGAVKTYNNLCQRFPSNIIARIFGFQPQEPFKITDEERKNVQIKF